MFTLKAKTIGDAWFQLVFNLPDYGYKQAIQSGSFENEQVRLQYSSVAVEIEMPWLDMYPTMPEGSNIPPVSSKETVEDYFANYLMDPELAENETYKYASRINEDVKHKHCQVAMVTQLEVVMEMLKKTPLTNQACIEIAKPSDVVTCVGNDGKLDPPCLRLIDFKVIPKQCKFGGHENYSECPICKNKSIFSLDVHVYFRSWDLWAGFPVNLGGIELLKQYVANECNLVNGKMFAYSSGLHLYGYQKELAELRTKRTILKW